MNRVTKDQIRGFEILAGEILTLLQLMMRCQKRREFKLSNFKERVTCGFSIHESWLKLAIEKAAGLLKCSIEWLNNGNEFVLEAQNNT